MRSQAQRVETKNRLRFLDMLYVGFFPRIALQAAWEGWQGTLNSDPTQAAERSFPTGVGVQRGQ